jgi:serine/threonine protein kinase
MRLTEGDMVAQYKVLSTLGSGAMGAVYKVFDTKLKVERALKIVKLPELHDEEQVAEYRERFFREARTLAGLHSPMPHPNIIQIYDMGDLNGFPWFAMASFPGVTLSDWISQKPRPHPDRALHVMRQLAAGLAHAHKSGVKHRDIKLGNALVSPSQDDHAVLIDWGIAKNDDDNQNLTMTGQMTGTESYMAPEYLLAGHQGAAVHTEQTDLWSLGVVFYALATGRRPFDGNQPDFRKRIIQGAFIPLQTARTDLDDDFAAVINDLLRVDPALRIKTAKELCQRLGALTRAVDPQKPPHVQSGGHSITQTPPQEPKTPSTSGVPNMKVVNLDGSLELAPTSRGGRIAGPGTASAAGGTPSVAAAEAIDPFAAALQPSASMKSDTGMALPSDGDGTEDIADELFATEMAKPPKPSNLLPQTPAVQAAAQAAVPSPTVPAVVEAPAVSAVAADSATFLGAVHGESRAAAHAEPERRDVPTPMLSKDGPSVVGKAPPAVEDEGSVVRDVVSFGAAAQSLRADRSKVEFRRGGILAAAAAVGFIVVGFTVTSMFEADPAAVTSKPFVDPSTVATQKNAQFAVDEVNREKKAQEEQQLKVALAIEERRRAQEAAAAAAAAEAAAGLPPVPQPPPTGIQASTGTRRASGGGTAPAPPPPPPAGPASRYGTRSTGNSASITSATTGGSASPASAAVEGIRIPARLKAQATSASGPIIALVTQETQVGTLRVPAGTEIHGTSSGANGPRLQISFSTALIGGRNVSLRGSAFGADQRGGLPGTRTIGNGSDTAADVAGSVVGSAGAALADAVGLAPVADATRAATGSATRKTGRLNSEEDLLVVPASTRFFIYVQSL